MIKISPNVQFLKKLQAISGDVSQLRNEIDHIAETEIIKTLSQKNIQSRFNTLNTQFSAVRHQWLDMNRVSALEGYGALMLGLFQKVVWFVLLDTGRILQKIFGYHEYALVGKVFDLDQDELRLRYGIHKDLRYISDVLNGLSQKDKKKSTTKQGVYWSWKSLEWIRIIPRRILEVIVHLMMLPLILAYAPSFYGLWIFIFTSSAMGVNHFGMVMHGYAHGILKYSTALLSSIKIYFLGHGEVNTTSPSQILSRAIAPRKIDWSKFIRGALYTFIPMLMSQIMLFYYYTPQINLFQWAITTIVAAVLYLIQTLCEEVEFRRPAADQSQSMLELIWNTTVSSILFGVAHLWNPEFSVIGHNLYSKLALLTGYCLSGLFYGIACYLSSGLELTWGMHFANNFFIATVIGYYPNPMPGMALLTFSRGPGSSTSAFFEAINTASKFMVHFSSVFSIELSKWLKIYFAEIVFARHAYAVPELSSDSIAVAEIFNEKPAKSSHITQTKDPVKKAAKEESISFKLPKIFGEMSEAVRSYMSPIAQGSIV